MVLTYTGPPSPFEGRVLRIKKYKYAGTSNLEPYQSEYVRPGFSDAFVSSVLGEQYAIIGQGVGVERSFLEGIQKLIDEAKVRPAERAAIDGIDLEAIGVVVMEDLCFGSNIVAIEIKVWSFALLDLEMAMQR